MGHRLLAICLLLSVTCFAQKQGNIWYFGDGCGLDFSAGWATAISGGATYNDSYPHSEGTSVISDSAGSLLMYTNGQKLWNRNHTVMPNGDSLLGHMSSSQSSLIVPLPGSDSLFYVFTTDGFYQSDLKNGFRYSVVDMCLDSGRGDVISGRKNILLLDTVAEKLTAVRHSNGVDYWVITHKFYSNAFYAYLLTSAGIVDTTISHMGAWHGEYCSISSLPSRSAIGWLKASPDGTKLACVNGQTCYSISELFDFDRNLGWVYNPRELYTDSDAVSLYGVCFSPDNSKLYISSQMNNDRIYQYDLTAGGGNTAAIINSKTVIASHLGGPFFLALVLGPDGRIYVAQDRQNFLSVINYPNFAGAACNFQQSVIGLPGGSKCSLGLPNLLSYADYPATRKYVCSGCTSTTLDIAAGTAMLCTGDSAQICAPAGFAAYNWNTGDTGACIYAHVAGNYYLTATDNGGCASESNQAIVSFNQQQVVDIASGTATLCPGDSAQICAPAGFNSYNWNTGDTGACIYARVAGNYYLTATDNGGCSTESNRATVTFYPQPIVSVTVNGDTLTVFSGVSYQWYLNGDPLPGKTSSQLIAKLSGLYTVRVTDANGCVAVSNPTQVIITGLGKIFSEAKISLRYQPESGVLNVVTGEFAINSIRIYDLNGKLMLEKNTGSDNNVEVMELPKGMYIAEIIGPEIWVKRRWLKN